MRQHKPSARQKSSHRYQVRIIGGQWKRSLLPVSVVPDLRPTPNRVRETLFNWLYTLFDGRWEEMVCLDLFAGTGAFGFEAASRGAQHVTMVESHRMAFEQLQATCEKLHAKSLVTLVQGDALLVAERLAAQEKRFDVIFLDPPFQADILPEILPFCAGLLKGNGVVYVESPVFLTEKTVAQSGQNDWQWHIIRQDKAGHVCYHLLQLRHADHF
ncbi:MAG: 16S rRNA (guanine(966)-N(2))-methyltransferase RsmD [Betaproteobacteria bacterium]|nr:16S rRNA (guanine(966)-N(2))-methyltransferase RsmD [Betaproteobacteria bacterium]